jgi:hypothetical protein
MHAIRRRAWAHGLTSTATKDYAPFVEARARQLVERLEGLTQTSGEGRAEAEIDIAAWLSYFTYVTPAIPDPHKLTRLLLAGLCSTDFMGDMALVCYTLEIPGCPSDTRL